MRAHEEDEPDEFLDASLMAFEHQRELERVRGFGARVHVDMTDRSSSLHAYVMSRRDVALQALDALVKVDAGDGLGITRLQAIVQQYLDVRDWARGAIQDAQTADHAIQEGSNVEH